MVTKAILGEMERCDKNGIEDSGGGRKRRNYEKKWLEKKLIKNAFVLHVTAKKKNYLSKFTFKMTPPRKISMIRDIALVLRGNRK